jgi:hypothetical protein
MEWRERERGREGERERGKKRGLRNNKKWFSAI